MSKHAYLQTITSWLGPISFGYHPDAIVCVSIGNSSRDHVTDELVRLGFSIESGEAPVGKRFAKELHRYFDGALRSFTIPFELFGTPFQVEVWRELAKVPFGQFISYKDLAKRVGHPNAYRAVGTTMARNRLPILVPCHRVVAAGGKLGGFSGGLENKRHLLTHEGARLNGS